MLVIDGLSAAQRADRSQLVIDQRKKQSVGTRHPMLQVFDRYLTTGQHHFDEAAGHFGGAVNGMSHPGFYFSVVHTGRSGIFMSVVKFLAFVINLVVISNDQLDQMIVAGAFEMAARLHIVGFFSTIGETRSFSTRWMA